MPRGRWHRIVSMILALCFVIRMTEPAPLRICPMHSAAPTAAAAPADGTHEAHEAHEAHRHGHDMPSDSTHECSCGAACCESMLVAAPEPTESFVQIISDGPSAPGRPHHEFMAAWVDFVLPFANAPPRVTTA